MRLLSGLILKVFRAKVEKSILSMSFSDTALLGGFSFEQAVKHIQTRKIAEYNCKLFFGIWQFTVLMVSKLCPDFYKGSYVQ